MARKKNVVRGKDTLKLGLAGSRALAIGSLLEDLGVAERSLTYVLENREDRDGARLTPLAEDVLFAAWHATRGAVQLLRELDPWRERGLGGTGHATRR